MANEQLTKDQARALDEESPLLQSTAGRARDEEQQITPLPKVQLGVLLLLQLVEPICAFCIIPFLNQLIADLDITGGDEKKVGYYAGIIWFCFFLAEAIFVLHWSRLSDRIGRKPVLLTGLVGLCISMISFGLVRSFIGLAISRGFAGATNGNIGVLKSLMGEMTDSTNMAQAFAYVPLVWAIGMTVGPFAGGLLSRPYDRLPSLFRHQFWKGHPYFLPCLFSAGFTAFAFLIALIFLKETVPKKSKLKGLPSEAPHPPGETSEVDEITPPLSSRVTRPVILSIINYFALALVDMCWISLLPLFYSTPMEFGGLGLGPPLIGTCVGIYGLVNGVLQSLVFASFIERFGAQRVYIAGMLSFVTIFTLFPIISEVARVQGLSPTVWGLVTLQLALAISADMSYGAIFMFITTSVPTKRSLGGLNGIAQTIASLSRAFGPAGASALFALSLEHKWMGGHAIWYVLIAVTCGCIIPAVYLPRNSWKH